MAANIRRAATDGQVPDQDSLKRMIWRWEREGLSAERYQLLYARVLGIGPDDLAGGPPGLVVSGGHEDSGGGETEVTGAAPEKFGDVSAHMSPAGSTAIDSPAP